MDKIEDEIVAGGWRCLCIGVLINAIREVESNCKMFRFTSHRLGRASGTDKEALENKRLTKAWLNGGIGLVTFEDCCEAMSIPPDKAREKILQRAKERRRNRELTEVRSAW